MSTPDPDATARMHAIAAALTAAGLTAQVHITRGVLDVTATWERPDAKAAEVIVDDDGYAEIRYWNQPQATPNQVATVIVRALATATATQRTQPPLAGHARERHQTNDRTDTQPAPSDPSAEQHRPPPRRPLPDGTPRAQLRPSASFGPVSRDQEGQMQ